MRFEADNTDGKRWIIWVTKEGEKTICGSFDISVDTETYHNICVLSFCFTRNDTETAKEALEILSKSSQMPLFFKRWKFDPDKDEILKSMGAELVEDTEGVTIWWNEADKWVWRLDP